jgi:hypothetical protein
MHVYSKDIPNLRSICCAFTSAILNFFIEGNNTEEGTKYILGRTQYAMLLFSCQ